ncbi:MAG: acyl-CoA dehydrogenase, partial [Bdellovibrionota bacterium]
SHIAISEAAAEVDAAELLLLRDIAEMRAFAEAGAPVPLECRARYKRDSAYAVTLCARAGHRLFSKSGGNALYDSSPLQRGFRDLHAMEVHALLNFDNSGEQYGRIRLGLPPTNPVI